MRLRRRWRKLVGAFATAAKEEKPLAERPEETGPYYKR